MRSRGDHPISPWISLSKRAWNSGRLFCFPYAGGGALTYHSWPNRILKGIEVARVNLPGREARFKEPLFRDLQSLVDVLADELIPWIDRPFAFYGHSMGALLAFELTRELRRRHNLLPHHLFVSGYGAPHSFFPGLLISELPDKDFLLKISQLGGLPDIIAQNEELMEIYLPILKADFQMLENYVYKEESPLECPLTAFGGLSDPIFNRDSILAWNIHTNVKFESLFFPGGHFFLLDSEPRVIDQINFYLDQSLFAH